jgi:guanine deaminase
MSIHSVGYSASTCAPKFQGVELQDVSRMQRAVALSKWAADTNRFPIAATIIGPDGQEIAASTNTELDPSSPLAGTPIAHAEISAIVQACRRLGTRILPPGSKMITTCEPCPMCLGAMNFAGIKEFIYGNSVLDTNQFRAFGFKDADLYADFAKQAGLRQVPGFQLLRDQAFSVLQQWQQKLNMQGVYSFDSPQGQAYLRQVTPIPASLPKMNQLA